MKRILIFLGLKAKEIGLGLGVFAILVLIIIFLSVAGRYWFLGREPHDNMAWVLWVAMPISIGFCLGFGVLLVAIICSWLKDNWRKAGKLAAKGCVVLCLLMPQIGWAEDKSVYWEVEVFVCRYRIATNGKGVWRLEEFKNSTRWEEVPYSLAYTFKEIQENHRFRCAMQKRANDYLRGIEGPWWPVDSETGRKIEK